MAASLFLSLRDGATLAAGGDGQLLVRADGSGFTFKRLTPGVWAALHCLGDGGEYEEPLAQRVGQEDGAPGVSLWYYCLQQLGRRRLLLRSVNGRGGRFVTLVPVSEHFTYPGRAVAPDRPYALSRFAYLRTEGGQVLLESPLSHAKVLLHDGRAAALVHALARPNRTSDVVRQVVGLTADDVASVMDLLHNADMLGEADGAGIAGMDRPTALQCWEFHDLLFHARSREGRHANPVGGTYRFAGRLPPPPALKADSSGESVELYRPDLDQLQRGDPPLACVQERRRSVRDYASRPITVDQLGEFLFRVARVKGRTESEVETPGGPVPMDFTARPYPGGGALYEMEFYAVVNACEGLTPGLYHYDPGRHRLDRLAGRTVEVTRLLHAAARATGIPAESLQVELVLAARFQRVAWKYASMAYALVLKHVGVLYQTMYLAATAMDLAPCGVGCGDADLFSRAAGTDYYAESSVGEFLLGITQ